MQRMLFIESRTPGVLMVNGQFCGPLEGEGQAFPVGRSAEVYMQLFPFAPSCAPLCAALLLREGRIERLEPQEAAFALYWPDGVIELELRLPGAEAGAPAKEPPQAAGVLLRYLLLRLAGDSNAGGFLLRPQDAPDLSGYDAAVPLRYPPQSAPQRYDERAGLVRRAAPNIALVDAALAATVPAGQGRRMIEQVTIVPCGGAG